MDTLGFATREIGVDIKLVVKINDMLFYSAKSFETEKEAIKYAREHNIENAGRME